MTTLKLLAPVMAVALAGVSSACVDLKEEIISGVTSGYYATPSGYEALINATYEPLRSFYGQQRGYTLTVFGTDEFSKGADGGFKHYNDYTPSLNSSDGYVRDTWRDYFRAINTANAAIGRAKDVSLPDATRNLRVAEARFLRGFYLFDLVRIYGPIPLPLEETLQPTTEATREPVAKVYDAIIADLTAAEAGLPDVAAQYGRATRQAAKHLLAKVYLTRAAPGDMARAAAKAQEVINSNLFSLLPRFADVFALTNERNAEVVWAIQFTADPLTTGPGNEGHLFFIMEYDTRPGMIRDVANGRPFKRFRPTNWLLNLWDRTKDQRYEDSFKMAFIANNAATIPKDAAGKPRYAVGDTAIWLPGVELSAAERAAKPYLIFTPSQYEDRSFPTLSKYLDGTRLTINDTRGQRDVLLYRLADTYLMAGEALFRDGKTAEAVPFFNKVRERAAKPGQTAAMRITAADLDLDWILDERARELAGESTRWFDLVRTGKLVERVKKYNPVAAPLVQAFHSLRPIPADQIDRTTNAFAQNPGY